VGIFSSFFWLICFEGHGAAKCKYVSMKRTKVKPFIQFLVIFYAIHPMIPASVPATETTSG